MDNTQRMILLLLVLAIMFSAISIYFSFSALNIEVPESNKNPTQGNVVRSSGGVGLIVEEPPVSEVGNNG